MLKKYLSVFLILGMLINIGGVATTSAEVNSVEVEETTQIGPYVHYDFEERSDIGAVSAYGSMPFSPDYNSWTDGAGGSKGAVYVSSPKDVCHNVLNYQFTSNPKGLLVGKFKISFWFKLDADKTQFKDMSEINLLFRRGYYDDYIVNQWKIPFDSTVANKGEWFYASNTFEWDGTFSQNGTSILDDADDVAYSFQFRFNGQVGLANVITDDSTDCSYAIDDFRVERILDVPTYHELKHDFNDASTYQAPSEYGTFNFGQSSVGSEQITDWDTLVTGKDGTALYRKTPKKIGTTNTTYKDQLLYYKFTGNPKDLIGNKFKISFWFKLDNSVCQLNTTNVPDIKLRLRRETGSHSVMWSLPFDVTTANNGEWIYVSKEIEWDGIFTNGGSNINNLADTENFYFDFFFFSSETAPGTWWVSDAATKNIKSGDYLAYAIDDFCVAKLINDEVPAKPAFCTPEISGELIEGSELAINYTWDSGETGKTEGNTIVRVLKETANGSNQYVAVKEFHKANDDDMVFRIPDGYEGTRLLVEILPIASDGALMPYCYSETSEPVSICYALYNLSENNYYIKSTYSENFSGKAIIVSYAEERMVGFDIFDMDGAVLERTATFLQTPDTIKVLLWSDLEKFKPLTKAKTANIYMQSIYVDAQSGNDNYIGTQDKPLKSIYAARDMVAIYQDSMQSDITIYIRGEHYLDKTFTLDETNSGKNGHSVIYTSWGNEKPVLTMAKKYNGFELHDAEKNIYKTYVGVGTHTRQAFFNEVRGIRARTVGYLKNAEFVNEEYYLCDNTELLDVEYPNEVDAIFHWKWIQSRFLLDEIVEENSRIRVNMSDYFKTDNGRITANTSLAKRISTPSYLENSYQFLDKKGEWYLNRHDGYMYYIPRDGENMSTMEVKIPLGEEMIIAQGSSYENSLENIVFDNIIFEGTTWLGPDRIGGHSPRQNNLYGGTIVWEELTYGLDGGSPGAAVHFEKCKNITISNSKFHQMGITALEVFDGAKNVEIIGNEFCDISGSSMLIDDCADTGAPDKRSEESYVEYVDITNNYIHNVSIDYQGAAAFGWGWPRHSKFNHNEIAYTQYSGTHTGWGWGAYDTTGSIMYDIEMNYNYIHDIMVNRVNDGSGMYSVGKSSFECDTSTPESTDTGVNKNRIIGNYLVNGWQSDLIYPDQNSGSWYIAQNVADVGPYRREIEYNFDREVSDSDDGYWLHMWADTIKWMTVVDNYATHDYAYDAGYMKQTESYVEPVNIYANRKWPEAAKAIIKNAGIEPEYKDNFKLTGPKIFVSNDRWQDITVGTPADAGILILGDYNTKYPVENFEINFWCDEPGAVTLDEHGMLTAHKEGEFECEAFVTIDGMVMSQHWILNCSSAD